MKLEPMSYKNYTWKYNPKEVRIIQQRNINEVSIPYSDSIAEDFGGMKRIIKGTGEFFGNNCVNEFERLRMVLIEGGSGYLNIPKLEPFLAAFRSLEMIERSEPDIISYEFEFIETGDSEIHLEVPFPEYHIVESGETLWHIANKYSAEIMELLEMNTFIKRPDSLLQGDRVRVS